MYSSSFPIYLFTQHEEEVPEEEPESVSETEEVREERPDSSVDTDEDEVIVEDVSEDEVKPEKEVKTKKVIVDEWMHLNPLAPVWTRLVQVISFYWLFILLVAHTQRP